MSVELHKVCSVRVTLVNTLSPPLNLQISTMHFRHGVKLLPFWAGD